MNLLPRLTPWRLMDWFRDLLHVGVKAAAVKDLAETQVDVLEAQERLLDKGIELARKTKAYRESTDDFERELAAAFTSAMKETIRLGQSMGFETPEERAEVLSRPLSDSNGSLKPWSSGSEPPAVETNGSMKSLLAPPTPASQEPVKRGRGRPQGSKNRAKAQVPEAKTEESPINTVKRPE